MKIKMSSRKFIAWLSGMICLNVVMTLTVFKAPYAVTGFAPWYVAGLIFLTAVFIGGVVWSDFVKSKYFRADLVGK